MCQFLLIGWLWNNGGVPEILCSAWSYHPPPGWGGLSSFRTQEILLCVSDEGLGLCFVVVVESLSPVQLFATPWTAARQAFLSLTISWSLLKLMSIEPMMPSNHLVLYCPLLLLPSVFPSIRVFSDEKALRIRWSKDWIFSSSISPSNEDSGLISFRIDWFDLLAVQGTLKGLLQHHSSKASILRRSVFFMVQLSHPYMTTGKNHSFD